MSDQQNQPAVPAVPNQKKQRKHNYTNELELKSLLIRIKNDRKDLGDYSLNPLVNKYVRLHARLNDLRYDSQEMTRKKNALKVKVKDSAVRLSGQTRVDQASYERFGEIVLLMIKNILRKPQFSGYTYRDDFYSDAVYKITKYLHNFDHTKISVITGQTVNAFSYISQYIHNSVIYIIKKKKKESDKMKKRIQMENLNHNLQLKNYELIIEENFRDYVDVDPRDDQVTVELRGINDLVQEISRLCRMKAEVDEMAGVKEKILVIYPQDYRITFDEYERLKPFLSSVSIERKRVQKDYPENQSLKEEQE